MGIDMDIFFGIYWYNIFVNYTKNAEKYNVIWNNMVWNNANKFT
jgi:hypothetical protein